MSRLIIKTVLWEKDMQDQIVPLAECGDDLLQRSQLWEKARRETSVALLFRRNGVPIEDGRRLVCASGFDVDVVVDLLWAGNPEMVALLREVQR